MFLKGHLYDGWFEAPEMGYKKSKSIITMTTIKEYVKNEKGIKEPYNLQIFNSIP